MKTNRQKIEREREMIRRELYESAFSGEFCAARLRALEAKWKKEDEELDREERDQNTIAPERSLKDD